MERIWTCKIGGEVDELPEGADAPMRQAVAEAFHRLTGREATFTFSGWGGKLDVYERDAVARQEKQS